MPNKCLVPACGASYRKNPSLNFFSFVRNQERRLQWITAIEKATGERLDFHTIDINDRICSLHFKTDDIITEAKERGDFKFLKKDAVPSIFKFTNSSANRAQSSIRLRKKCRLCLKQTGLNYMNLSDIIPTSEISIADALDSTLGFKFNDPSRYPQKVCTNCYNQVVSSFNFKNSIQSVNENLREIFEKDSNKRQTLKRKVTAKPLFDEGESSSSNPFERKNISPIEDLVDRIKVEKEDGDEFEDDETPLRNSKRKFKHEPIEDIHSHFLEVELTEVDQKSKRKYEKSSQKIGKKICKKCNFAADSVLVLLKHIDDSKKNCSDCYEPTKECYICHKRFMLDVKKREHVRRDHLDYALKDCPHCIRARLKTPTAYELHVRQHFAQPDFLCTNCGKGFFKKELYEMHMRHHDPLFWMFCDLCSYKCKIKNSMSIHLKHHFDIRPYVCDKCCKSFHKSNALSQHIFQVHKTTNKGCYKCKKCEYCFLHRRDIIRHNVYCEGQSKNPINCPRVKFTDLDPNCVIKELLEDENKLN